MIQQVADSALSAARAIQDTTLRHEIFRRLDAFAAKTGVAVEYLWTVLVRQAYAEFAISLVWFIIWAIALTVTVKGCRRSWEAGFTGKTQRGVWTDSDSIRATIWTIATVVAVAGFFITASGFAHGVGYLINPDYFAFERAAQFIFGSGGRH